LLSSAESPKKNRERAGNVYLTAKDDSTLRRQITPMSPNRTSSVVTLASSCAGCPAALSTRYRRSVQTRWWLAGRLRKASKRHCGHSRQQPLVFVPAPDPTARRPRRSRCAQRNW